TAASCAERRGPPLLPAARTGTGRVARQARRRAGPAVDPSTPDERPDHARGERAGAATVVYARSRRGRAASFEPRLRRSSARPCIFVGSNRKRGSGGAMAVDAAVRELLSKLLAWEDAHAGFDAAVANVAPEMRAKQPAGLPYSPWQLLEHLRRT